jgi:hypothetical protein
MQGQHTWQQFQLGKVVQMGGKCALLGSQGSARL